MRYCIVCGGPCPPGRVTCSEACHEAFVRMVEEAFGKYKKVIDVETGKAYRVPTRFIIEHGLRHDQLKEFPEWDEG